MAGSVRKSSCGSETGPANVTIHESEALIAIPKARLNGHL